MSSSSDFELIHGQLHVTRDQTAPEALGRGRRKIRGSSYVQGPIHFGNDKTFHPDKSAGRFSDIWPKPEATVMIGPLENLESPVPLICDNDDVPETGGKKEFIDPWSITACGISRSGATKYGKELAHPYCLVVRSGTHITKPVKCQQPDNYIPDGAVEETESEATAFFVGDVDIYGYTRIKEDLSVCKTADFAEDVIIKDSLIVGQDVYVGRDVCITGDLVAENIVARSNLDGNPIGRLLDRIELADARPKPFDMVHPSLGDGHRLRYACIEGPEVGVYHRGRVKNSTEIDLPWYWKDLVHVESITVQLQPVGSHQDVIVKRWDENKIYLQSKGGMPIDCFFHVYAERKDVNALVVEYEGKEHTDYPDATYNDPQFAGKINTKTT